MGNSVAIIGGGISGLSTGCYARMNGMNACIFELHDKPGGLCTAWEREGYTFDTCIEWLLGTAQGSVFNRVWRELGALQGRAIHFHEELHRHELADGRALILYRDPERLGRHP
jgi:phytoene dehydrogenase-like protein